MAAVQLMHGLGNTFTVLDGRDEGVARSFFEPLRSPELLRQYVPLATVEALLPADLAVCVRDSCRTAADIGGLADESVRRRVEAAVAWPSLLAQAICERYGTDGLLVPTAGADVTMNYYNRDGSRGEMCGNGLRCVAKFTGLPHGVVQTDCGPRHFRLVGDESLVSVGMGEPTVYDWTAGRHRPLAELLPPDAAASLHRSYACSDHAWLFERAALYRLLVGVPHLVVLLSPDIGRHQLDAVDDAAFALVGRRLQVDRSFGEHGNNVEFVVPLHSQHYYQRTYERGCGETQACGSGACAVFTALLLAGRLDPVAPQATIVMKGGSLLIQLDSSSAGQLLMTGPAAYSQH